MMSKKHFLSESNSDKQSAFDYYQQAQEWRYQIYESQQVWLRRSLIGIMLLVVLLILSLSANFFLFPLKQSVPFLYTVNETTGELTQLGSYDSNKFNQSWLMTRFLLVRYVVNRESYDADNLNQPYQIAWAMSAQNVAQDYAASVRTDNDNSPYALYGKNKYVTVHVVAVNQLNDATAAVRFEQTIHDRSGNADQVIQKEAIVKWQYTTPITTEKMLDRDPLGFQITYYQPTQINVDTP